MKTFIKITLGVILVFTPFVISSSAENGFVPTLIGVLTTLGTIGIMVAGMFLIFTDLW